MAKDTDKKKYKCMNFGACAKADSGEIIEFDAMDVIGGKPKCPHCNQDTLEEQLPGGMKINKIAVACGGLAVLAGLGVGGYFMMSGEEPATQPEEHSARISKIDAGEGWTVQTDLSKVAAEKDTVWIAAVGKMSKEVAANGATLAVTLEDSTATMTPADVTLKGGDVTTVTVTSADGKQCKYTLALKQPEIQEKPVTESEGKQGGNTGGNTAKKAGGSWKSYATFDGTTMVFKKAHVIPGTNEMAQPGDKVTGVWDGGEVNAVRWYHADGSPSETLTHK